ncbi:MAG: hypothetical protein F6K00_01330 [Leptolyngbya sp. SIOISBB]|nr:hypothetical protein [Leptolyngbya sp. SIOISBB]
MSVLKFLTSLGLGMSSVLATTTVLAAPASVFGPILDDLPTDNPAIPALRMPTTVPTDVELHPSVIPEAGIVFLNTEPGCEAIACTALVIAAESGPPPLWPFIGANPMKSVELVDGVQAHFWERDGMASFQWIQDDSFYILSYRQAIFPEEVAIAMATSMATEPPYLP